MEIEVTLTFSSSNRTSWLSDWDKTANTRFQRLLSLAPSQGHFLCAQKSRVCEMQPTLVPEKAALGRGLWGGEAGRAEGAEERAGAGVVFQEEVAAEDGLAQADAVHDLRRLVALHDVVHAVQSRGPFEKGWGMLAGGKTRRIGDRRSQRSRRRGQRWRT